MIVSGMFGRYAATRSPRPTPRRCRPCSRSADLLGQLVPRQRRRRTGLRAGDDRRLVAVMAQDVLGVVQAGVDEPPAAGHLRRGRAPRSTARWLARRRTPTPPPRTPAMSSTDHCHRSSYESNGPMPRSSSQVTNRPMLVPAIDSGVGAQRRSEDMATIEV